MNEQLINAIRENLSPEAIALIVANLQSGLGESDAAFQVRWFRDTLTAMVGGPDALAELFEEVGV